MLEHEQIWDAVVIGGGFYGTVIAIYLSRIQKLSRIALIEQESALMMRASYNNQARVHNGYHYPRSFTTAYRSRVNLPKFIESWPDAIYRNFVKLYAIARHRSKVTAGQFKRFCQEIGATLQPVEPALKTLFNPRLIEDVFLVEEYAFDVSQLVQWAKRELAYCQIPVFYETQVKNVYNANDDTLVLSMYSKQNDQYLQFRCRKVFNCTYSGLNSFRGDYSGTRTLLKHEITELALVEPPPVLKDIGITVMDGSFFSIMPFPPRGLHTLSHVRYTPHFSWIDEPGVSPYKQLEQYPCQSRVEWMIRDASRYVPMISHSIPQGSLFEVKTTLVKNETDDGRPILFEKSLELPDFISILGGKIDNIFDVLERISHECTEY